MPVLPRMLSRLIDVPFSALQWVLSWIVLLSIVYTYLINKLTQHPPPKQISIPIQIQNRKHTYLTHLHRIRTTQRLLAAQRQMLTSSTPFRLLDLPPEVSTQILAHAAYWPSTYAALLLTSTHAKTLTMTACLPKTPIHLLTPVHLRSFALLLSSHPSVPNLIRHLWITPLYADQLPVAVSIVAKCTRLETLATNLHVLRAGVTVHAMTGALSHTECVDLSVMKARREAWTEYLNTKSGGALLAQVMRLRLIGGGAEEVIMDVDEGCLNLPRLSGISFGTSGGGGGGGRHMQEGVKTGTTVALTMLEDKTRYPHLRTVLVTCGRGSSGGLRVSRPVTNKRVWVVELPWTRTELEMWCDNAHGKGLWLLCD